MRDTHLPKPTVTLTIRKVDPALRQKLRMRAAANGRSMEAEMRAILQASLASDDLPDIGLAEATRRLFAPFGGVELPEIVWAPDRPIPTFDE